MTGFISLQSKGLLRVFKLMIIPYFYGGGLVAKVCPTLATPWTITCQAPLSMGLSTGVGCHFLLQGIFLTQGSNPGLLHYRQILYQMSYEGRPIFIDLYIACMCSVAQLCLTLCDPKESLDCSQPGSFVHGIFHARINIGVVATSYFRGSDP